MDILDICIHLTFLFGDATKEGYYNIGGPFYHYNYCNTHIFNCYSAFIVVLHCLIFADYWIFFSSLLQTQTFIVIVWQYTPLCSSCMKVSNVYTVQTSILTAHVHIML